MIKFDLGFESKNTSKSTNEEELATNHKPSQIMHEREMPANHPTNKKRVDQARYTRSI